MKNTVLLLLVSCLGVVLSQRPFYAGSRPYYPELASRFDDIEPETNTTLVNRFGEDGNAGPTSSTTTERLPVDALGQKELIDRIKTWPREKWPFWYTNYLAIEEHRRKPVSGARPIMQPTFTQMVADQQKRFNQQAVEERFGGAEGGAVTQPPVNTGETIYAGRTPQVANPEIRFIPQDRYRQNTTSQTTNQNQQPSQSSQSFVSSQQQPQPSRPVQRMGWNQQQPTGTSQTSTLNLRRTETNRNQPQTQTSQTESTLDQKRQLEPTNNQKSGWNFSK